MGVFKEKRCKRELVQIRCGGFTGALPPCGAKPNPLSPGGHEVMGGGVVSRKKWI